MVVLLYGLLHSPLTKYQMAFRVFDRDRDGFIDRDEFIQVIRELSSPSTTTAAAAGGAGGGAVPDADEPGDQ